MAKKKEKKKEIVARAELTPKQLSEFFALFGEIHCSDTARIKVTSLHKKGLWRITIRVGKVDQGFLRGSFRNGVLHSHGWDQEFVITG